MMIVTRIVSYPRPEFPEGLPRPTDPHHCPAFTAPVAVYADRSGQAWTEHECQVCGDAYTVPADLEAMTTLPVVAELEPWPAAAGTSAPYPPKIRSATRAAAAGSAALFGLSALPMLAAGDWQGWLCLALAVGIALTLLADLAQAPGLPEGGDPR